MAANSKITLTQTDFSKLSTLLKTAPAEIVDLLDDELSRATVVPDEKLPQNVVSMNTRVTFKALDTSKEMDVVLVYPQDANMQESKISIFSSVGAALIGLSVGGKIRWPFPDGRERWLEVIAVKQS